jgi:hypothetical protein
MKKVSLLILSTGWIVTLLVSQYLNVVFLENEVYPIIYDTETQLNCFPYIHAAKTLLNITAAWFGLAVVGWSIYLFKQSRL